MKLDGIIKNTNNKYLNMYTAKYSNDKKHFDYFFASRRDMCDLQKTTMVDAVKIVPYIVDTDEIVFIRNFRYVINDYVYEMPAGLVDKGEDSLTAAKRETLEEIGAEIINIERVGNVGFTSVGMSDETMETYFAEVVINHNQELDAEEHIDVIKVKSSDVEEFLNTHTVDIITTLMVKLFLATRK